jgi:hypothetical protein
MVELCISDNAEETTVNKMLEGGTHSAEKLM